MTNETNTAAPGMGAHVLDRGFTYSKGVNIPTVLIGFAPEDWTSRDAFAAALAAQPAPGVGGEECEVCRIFGDANLLRKSATPVNSVDAEMVVRALDALSPEAVTNRYGYRKGYRVRDVLALDDYEATEVIRTALDAALSTRPAESVAQGGEVGAVAYQTRISTGLWRECEFEEYDRMSHNHPENARKLYATPTPAPAGGDGSSIHNVNASDEK